MSARSFVCMTLAAWASVAPSQARADDATTAFKAANDAYFRGESTDAVKRYRALVDAGHGSVDVLFNLGTALLKDGKRGEAILWLERAARLDPEDEDVAFNLAEAEKANVDKVVGEREETPFIERLGAKVPGWVPFAFALAWALAVTALLVRRFSPRGKAVLGLVSVACWVVAIPAGALTGAAAWRAVRSREAVVVVPTAPVREGPARDFKPAFEIHEGLKVRVVGTQDDFFRIRLPNGVEGWVAKDEVPRI